MIDPDLDPSNQKSGDDSPTRLPEPGTQVDAQRSADAKSDKPGAGSLDGRKFDTIEWSGPPPDSGASTVTFQKMDIAGVRPPRALGAEELPQPFGDYILTQVIARGGMGVVYRAVQKKLNRTVALKMILAGRLASPDDLQRFQSEAVAVAQLDHPGIVPIFEVGEHAGQQFFSMGFIEGGSLADRVREGPLSPRETARLVKEVAEAIAYAHERGIIHRDLKPSNVLLDKDGRPKVTDFGLAKNVREDSHLTITGQIVGTPSYMSPEQASGHPDTVGPAADIYALGALLYCLLTGRPPFQAANTMETLRLVLEQEPVSPQQLNVHVDRDLDTICLKCLSKEPPRRYATALELAEDLGRWLRDEPITARPVSRQQKLLRWCRRNRLAASLIAAVVLVMVLGTVISIYWAFRANRGEQKALELAAVARENEQRERDARALSERRLYIAEIHLAYQAWKDARVGVTLALLQHHVPRDEDAVDYRDFEWYHLQRLCQQDLRTLEGHTAAVTKVVFSPDGRRLASCSLDQTVRIWDAITGDHLLTLPGHTASIWALAFSPNGLALCSGDDKGFLRIWDVITGKPILTRKAHEAGIYDLAFSPDNKQIASASSDKTVKIWEATSGRPLHTLSGHGESVRALAYTLDSRLIASGTKDQTVKVWDAQTGQGIRTLRGHTGEVWCVAFSVDGRQLASAGSDKTVRVWDTTEGKPVRSLRGHGGTITGIAFSPTHQQLASCSRDQTIKVWDLKEGLDLLTLRGHTKDVLGLSFSPDGRRLASASVDTTVKIWDANAELDLMPTGHQNLIRSLAFSPDGRQFASAANLPNQGEQPLRGEVKIWDAVSQHQIHTFCSNGGIVPCVAYSPDSCWLATAVGWAHIREKPVPGVVKIWDTATGREQITLQGHTAAVQAVAFSSDGWLASGSDDHTVKVWDVASGRATRTFSGHTAAVLTVAFGAGGRLASGSADHTIKIWDLESEREPLTLQAHTEPISSLAFSPSALQLVSASEDGTVRVWDTTSGQQIFELKGHERLVWALAYVPSGERLATADADGIVKIWDAKTGIEVLTLPASDDSLYSLAFSPDGRELISGTSDAKIRVWDTRTLTAELRDQREARSVVQFLFARHISRQQILHRIREDVLLSPSVRALALAVAESYPE